MTDTTLTIADKLVFTLLDGVITDTTSEVVAIGPGPRVVQASIVGTGTVSVTVSWYGSNINSTSNGVLCATSTLSGTNSDSTGATITAEWPYMYCVTSSISGTDAAVTATIGD